MSLFLPPIVPFLFGRSHRACRDGKALPIGKLYDDAKQMMPRRGLSENVINRILSGCLRALYKSLAKTDFFDFIWFDAMLAYVFNSILRPDELVDRHSPILGKQMTARNVSAERFWRSAASGAGRHPRIRRNQGAPIGGSIAVLCGFYFARPLGPSDSI